MATTYVETSALVKRYVAEVGSAWVRRMVARPVHQVLYTAALSEVEVRSALQRLVREGRLDTVQAQRLTQRVTRHFTRRYQVSVAGTFACILGIFFGLYARQNGRATREFIAAGSKEMRDFIAAQNKDMRDLIAAENKDMREFLGRTLERLGERISFHTHFRRVHELLIKVK